MSVPKCAGHRKRHYFGQHRGYASSMAAIAGRKCLWCGWDRGFIYRGYWNIQWQKAMKILKPREAALAAVEAEAGEEG